MLSGVKQLPISLLCTSFKQDVSIASLSSTASCGCGNLLLCCCVLTEQPYTLQKLSHSSLTRFASDIAVKQRYPGRVANVFTTDV